MNWELHKKNLRKQNSIQMNYPDNSMSPQIEIGDNITITKINVGLFKEGDVVFCKIEKNHYINLITKVSVYGTKLRYEISDCNNNVIGNIGLKLILGKVTNIVKGNEDGRTN